MEKFGLLNLLKAIDGLSGADPTAEKEENLEPHPTGVQPEQTAKTPDGELPNFMYQTLLRHEAISNRLRNKR